ncbi:hypothetical protein [Rhizobium lentis]|uniref:Uncharacterized protein n=1 Tax=Rhizobium lentis TaxID=1138194 RepID=A0A9Q3MDJ6_9HYPH|nr:hypothetical protein [Rhizobium lentis]MBX4958966.1 hypothetical protein [Rhizobium lentis]MBX4977145.1 hypothetical protein [Rhizobium lentis]MBX4988972.1 hypothetical protein [Rhizobium lentis]MBX5000697.1 hypothetical protein [Rhizobium lentis]MBX5007421.1 hypothetical protein [Rhizobium lentis]
MISTTRLATLNQGLIRLRYDARAAFIPASSIFEESGSVHVAVMISSAKG